MDPVLDLTQKFSGEPDTADCSGAGRLVGWGGAGVVLCLSHCYTPESDVV